MRATLLAALILCVTVITPDSQPATNVRKAML